MRGIVLLFAVLLVGACSTDPYAFDYRPGGEVLHTFPAGEDAATITVRREPAYSGSAAGNVFLVDGVEVVNLGNGDEYTFRLDPGQYVIGVRCWWVVGEEFADIKPRRDYFFRVYNNMSESCQIAPMSS